MAKGRKLKAFGRKLKPGWKKFIRSDTAKDIGRTAKAVFGAYRKAAAKKAVEKAEDYLHQAGVPTPSELGVNLLGNGAGLGGGGYYLAGRGCVRRGRNGVPHGEFVLGKRRIKCGSTYRVRAGYVNRKAPSLVKKETRAKRTAKKARKAVATAKKASKKAVSAVNQANKAEQSLRRSLRNK